LAFVSSTGTAACPWAPSGGGKYLDLDVAAAGNTEVIRAKMRTMKSLRLDDLVLERQKANLALARHNLKRIENDLSV
jgi:hypothetical protein